MSIAGLSSFILPGMWYIRSPWIQSWFHPETFTTSPGLLVSLEPQAEPKGP